VVIKESIADGGWKPQYAEEFPHDLLGILSDDLADASIRDELTVTRSAFSDTGREKPYLHPLRGLLLPIRQKSDRNNPGTMTVPF
jgi:hypothetical protein